VGSYSEPAYGTVTISLKDDSLVLNWSSFQLPLKHFHYDTFVTPPKDRRLPASLAEEFAVFEMNEDAEVSISVSVAFTVSVMLCVDSPAVSVSPLSCAAVRLQVPSWLLVPADNAASEGIPLITIDRSG